MKEFYNVNICGRSENLPILTLPSGIKIAFFNLHGNPSLTEHCGKHIAKILKDKQIDILLTAESKGIELTHVVARELGHDRYILARKSKKIHMDEFVEVSLKAITGETNHCFYISVEDSKRLEGKRVAIVDDVISSGGSLNGLKEIIKKSHGILAASICVLAEGDSINNNEVLRLANLPLL